MASFAIETPAANVIKVFAGDKAVLFSYNTPIAAWIKENGSIKRYALSNPGSVTSKKHLNLYGPEKFLVHSDDHFQKVTAEELAEILG